MHLSSRSQARAFKFYKIYPKQRCQDPDESAEISSHDPHLSLPSLVPSLLLLAHQYIHGNVPTSLKELLTSRTLSRNLCSDSGNLLKPPRTKLGTLGDRAFCSATPRLWNALPDLLRAPQTVESFQKGLNRFFVIRLSVRLFLFFLPATHSWDQAVCLVCIVFIVLLTVFVFAFCFVCFCCFTLQHNKNAIQSALQMKMLPLIIKTIWYRSSIMIF